MQVFEKNYKFLVKDMDISDNGLSEGKRRVAGPIGLDRVNAERDMPTLILVHAVSVVNVDHQGLMAEIIPVDV